MTFRLRAARPADLEHLYEMAKLTGGGFTNLPPDRAALRSKLERAEAAFASDTDALGDELFVLVLEDARTGAVIVETVFAWPGLGQVTVQSILSRDFMVVQGVVLMGAFVTIALNLLADILYSAVDPRIRLDGVRR